MPIRLQISIAAFLTGFLIIATLLPAQEVGKKTPGRIIVDQSGNGDFVSIHKALERACEGQSILIMPGIYRESLWLRAGISLEGYQVDQCRIEAPDGAAAAVVVMNAHSAKYPTIIESLTFSGTGRLQKIQDLGVDLVDKTNGVYSGKIIPGGPADKAGVLFGARLISIDGWKIDYVEKARCLIAQNEGKAPVTITFDGGPAYKSRRMLSFPRLVNGRWPKGVAVIDSGVIIRDCKFEKLGGDGVWVGGDQSCCRLYKNQFRNIRGNGLVFAHGAMGCVRENFFGDNLNGIVIKDMGTSPIIEDNRMMNNTQSGLLYEKSSGGIARNNESVGNHDDGIRVSGELTNPTLIANNCINNSDNGIYFRQKASGTAMNNVCWRNGQHGIKMGPLVTNVLIMSNQCRQNKASGIMVQNGGANMIMENQSEANGKCGLHIDARIRNTPFCRDNIFRSNKEKDRYIQK